MVSRCVVDGGEQAYIQRQTTSIRNINWPAKPPAMFKRSHDNPVDPPLAATKATTCGSVTRKTNFGPAAPPMKLICLWHEIAITSLRKMMVEYVCCSALTENGLKRLNVNNIHTSTSDNNFVGRFVHNRQQHADAGDTKQVFFSFIARSAQLRTAG